MRKLSGQETERGGRGELVISCDNVISLKVAISPPAVIAIIPPAEDYLVSQHFTL